MAEAQGRRHHRHRVPPTIDGCRMDDPTIPLRVADGRVGLGQWDRDAPRTTHSV